MKIKSILSIILCFLIVAILIYGFQKPENEDYFNENIKVALRDVGNKLLLANKDSTSLVLPVIKIGDRRYELYFEHPLAISPDELVSVVDNSLKTANLSERYIVEVKKCATEQISYSFKIIGNKEKDIVPCSGRNLPKDCYSIQVLFLEEPLLSNSNSYLIFGSLIVLGLAMFLVIINSKKNMVISKKHSDSGIKMGNYQFFEDQNKLVKDDKDIKLSSKECEVLKLLSSNKNEIVKREVLIKEIWEDNGVFVGRSLDTFISKLRKKFKDDDTIHIVNIHGVGYKLEVN